MFEEKEERTKYDLVKKEIEKEKLFVKEYSKYKRKKEIKNDSSSE
jgi:hypothetical protein